MNSHDPTPERLDAILDARETAVTGRERDLVDLAAALRDAAPPAGAELRARVRAIETARPASRLRRLTGSWRGRAVIAAPALAALAVAVIATGVIGGDDPPGDSARVAGTTSVESQPGPLSTQATPRSDVQTPSDAQTRGGAPGPAASGTPEGAPVTVTIRVPPADVAARAAEARRIVLAAGGAIQDGAAGAGPAGVAITATVPGAGAPDAFEKLRALGGQVPSPAAAKSTAAAGGTVAVTIRIVPSS